MNKRTKDIVGELLKTEKPLTIAGLAKKFRCRNAPSVTI